MIVLIALAVGWVLLSMLAGLWLGPIMRDPDEADTAGEAWESVTSVASAGSEAIHLKKEYLTPERVPSR